MIESLPAIAILSSRRAWKLPHWFRNALGLEDLAARTDRIDVYTNTLDTARRELIELVDREIGS